MVKFDPKFQISWWFHCVGWFASGLVVISIALRSGDINRFAIGSVMLAISFLFAAIHELQQRERERGEK